MKKGAKAQWRGTMCDAAPAKKRSTGQIASASPVRLRRQFHRTSGRRIAKARAAADLRYHKEKAGLPATLKLADGEAAVRDLCAYSASSRYA